MQVGKCFRTFGSAELFWRRYLGDRGVGAPSQKGFLLTKSPKPRLPSLCHHKITLDTLWT